MGDKTPFLDILFGSFELLSQIESVENLVYLHFFRQIIDQLPEFLFGDDQLVPFPEEIVQSGSTQPLNR